MKYPIVVSTVAIVIYVLFANNFCVCNKHEFGSRSDYYISKLYERKLIDDSENDVPKDYTIIYKFIGDLSLSTLYFEIDVNKESTGSIEVSKGPHDYMHLDRRDTYSKYAATICIKNATHVTANLSIYSFYTFDLPQYRRRLSRYSIAYVHVKNTTSTEKRYAQNSIGKRHRGDELIYFESRNVTNTSRFPSRVFEYSGSAYLTCVGFSFNSPTAMVLVNTSFVNEKEFNAIVYDMNDEHFVANMSIYGLKTMHRPTDFSGII